MHWITDLGSEIKTIFRFNLKSNGTLVERYTGQLATTLAKDVFSLNLNIDCLVTVRIELYVSITGELSDQPFIRELQESADLNLLCDSRASFPIGPSYISGNGRYSSIKVIMV